MGRIKKSELGWPGRRLGMTGLCSIIPARMLLVGGSCYTGISAKMEEAGHAWSTAQLGICNHQGKRPPLLTIPRGQQGVQGAQKGIGGCATWRHGCTHSDDIQPLSSRAAEVAGCEQTGFAGGFCDVGPAVTFPLSPAYPSYCSPSPCPPTSTPAPCVMVS